MRILQIIQKRQLRGAEICACQLSCELLKTDGVHVDVVYLFSNEVNALNYNLLFIPLNADQRKRFWDIKAFRRLAEIINKGSYDIVQANAGDTLKYAVLSKFIFGWRAKLIFRNANKMSGFIRSKFQLIFNRWLLRQCDFFISVTEDSRQDLIRLLPAADAKSKAITIGSYLFENVLPIGRKIDVSEPVFVTIGSFVPEKNHIFLMEVFHLFYTRYGAGYLWLVGDGKERNNLVQKSEKLGVNNRVHFWGYRDDVISVLKSSDVLVMTSLLEGLPAVILEAISCEIPVVTSKVGGIPEIIEHDVTGICIAEWSAELYVKYLYKLWKDTDYQKKLIISAKEKFLERFTMKKITNEFLTQYRELL